jgi:hypothetical protein
MDESSRCAIDLTEAVARLNHAQVIESSLLAGSLAEVWESIASMAGVNAELMPALRMTCPRGYERLDRVRFGPRQR